MVSFVNDSSPRIVNNIFENNPGRAINMTLPVGNQPEVINNTIVKNRTGVRVDRRVDASLQVYLNNIIVGNEIGLEVDMGSEVDNPTWENNLVFDNDIDYSGISDQTGLNGNISADPMFVDPAGGDYHLQAGSPCIDAGTNEGAPTADIEGNPRPIDGDADSTATTDMGAYEYVPPQPVGGTIIPTDKLRLVMPWVIAAALIVAAGVSLAVWNRKRGRRRALGS